MKYIDADNLLAELDTKRKDCLIAHNEFRTDDPELASFYEGKAKMCAELSNYINYLKQKQPDFQTTDEQVKEFLVTNPEIKVPEKYKNSDWLLKEQDLEEEINDFLLNNSEFLIESDSKAVVQKLAHHFYELGKLKARKEE